MQLTGKTAVVTGGGTGIGAAVAVSLANEGCRVVICGRREEPLQAVLDAYDGEMLLRTCDVANRDDVNSFFAWATEQLGQIDILVQSAGINVPKRSSAELSPEDWDRIMSVNATGAYNCLAAVLPGMRSRGDGLVVNISSVAGIRASPLGGPAYAASKFAMSALGLTVGLEVKDDGVRISNVYPGEVETPILDKRPVPVSAEHRAKILQPEDVASAVHLIACLPPRAHIPELTITPTTQGFC
jgi:NADP-dependent 3-hydroxy acid dehydrogenase YdfG